jgi:nitroreductase
MKAIDALTTRVSSARLQEPAPSQEQLDLLFQAAARAADHGMLKPYRFLVVSGNDDLRALGTLYREASLIKDASLSEQQLERMQNLPLRAPMVVVAIACCQTHPKVPEIEQQLTAAAAVQNMINAAYAIDIGAYWRTGSIAYHPTVRLGLGLKGNESIIGYVYLGRSCADKRTLKPRDLEVDVRSWPLRE